MNTFTITVEIDMTKSYADNKRQVFTAFLRSYLPVLINAHDGVIAQAAITAQTDRKHLGMLVKRYLKTDEERERKWYDG